MRRILMAVLVAIALVGAGVSLGQVGDGLPSSTSVDAGFARDMQTHHAQAVEMGLIVLSRTQDPEVGLLAGDIVTQQGAQIGIMSQWLSEWKLPQYDPKAPSMSWMPASAMGGMSGMPGMSGMSGSMPGMDMSGGSGAEMGVSMPGMASTAQIEQLKSLSGKAAEVEFLQLMITHHEGALPMAEEAQMHASQGEVRDLASKMIASQRSEITSMQQMLKERGVSS